MTLRTTIRRCLAWPLGLALAFLCGCGGGSGSGPAPAGPAAPAAVVIGSAGGTVTGPDGVTLDVPPGALAVDTSLQIAAVDAASLLPLPAGVATSSTFYALLPHGTKFSVPVTLTVPRAVGAAAPDTAILKTNVDGTAWEQLATTASGSNHVALITSFSGVVVGYTPCSSCPVMGPPPVISMQPASGDVDEGGFVFISVAVIGDAPFTYQWYRGVAIPGETTAALVVNPVSIGDDGMRLLVVATDRFGRSVTSAPAVIHVRPLRPQITSEPLDVVAVAGSTAVFSAATTSAVAQTLQWERMNPGVPGWIAAPSQSAQLALPNVQIADDQALFHLTATNPGGSVSTRAARLTVLPAQTVPVILAQPVDVTTLAGNSTSFRVLASGGGLDYEWQRSDHGGPFVAVGAAGASAVLTLSNTALGDDGARFRVLVTNLQGAALSDVATLTVPSSVAASITRLDGGHAHSVGLHADGSLYAWGSNTVGQLGRGTISRSEAPQQIAGLTGVATFAVGASSTLAIRADGLAFAWGYGQNYLLGDGSATNRLLPVPVGSLLPPLRFAAIGYQSSLSGDGVSGFLSWGYGYHGDGRFTTLQTPTPIVGPTFVRAAISRGSRVNHSLGLRNDGSVWSWGNNMHGELGTGDLRARLVPQPIGGVARAIAIAAGEFHSLALTADGTVYAWGRNVEGQLGIGAGLSAPSPVAVSLPGLAVGIAAGASHSVALLADGRVYAWGQGVDGQLGNGAGAASPTPVLVGGGWVGRAVGIGAGENHTLALDASGGVWAWGANDRMQLGDGTVLSRNLPVQVQGLRLE